MTDKKNRYYYFYIFAALLILLDQFTKLLFKDIFGIANIFGLQNLDAIASGRIPVIGDFLQFVYVENEGMAFGITFVFLKYFLAYFLWLQVLLLLI
jgi:lipoprotein signal peptidase